MTKSGKWALHYDCCVSCRRTDRPHKAHGRCELCYDHQFTHADRRAEFARHKSRLAAISDLVTEKYMDGWTAPQLAAAMGYTISKVKGILYRAGLGKVGGKNQRVRA